MQRKSSFTGLLITALCAVASCKLREYHYVSEQKTWSEAQQHCREHYTDLAFISNQEEVDQLSPISRGAWTWIGLHRDANDPTGWTWSGQRSKFRFWNSGEPNNAGGSQDCVMVQWNMRWVDSVCSQKLPFFCYKENLILVQEMKTWAEALEYCRNHYTDLPSLLSQTEHLQAQSKMESTQTNQVWTGLIFLARKWLWVNGDPLEFQAWTGGKLPHCPGQHLHCGTLTRDEEHWGTRNCTERRNFLCYRAWLDSVCSQKLPFFCYKENLILVQEMKTWEEALEYCRNHYTDLPSLLRLSISRQDQTTGHRCQLNI